MSNPLIGLLAKQANSSMPGPMQMISQFSQFRQNWTPQAAQAKINEMIQSGQINQQQYEQAVQMANQWSGFFRK